MKTRYQNVPTCGTACGYGDWIKDKRHVTTDDTRQLSDTWSIVLSHSTTVHMRLYTENERSLLNRFKSRHWLYDMTFSCCLPAGDRCWWRCWWWRSPMNSQLATWTLPRVWHIACLYTDSYRMCWHHALQGAGTAAADRLYDILPHPQWHHRLSSCTLRTFLCQFSYCIL